MINIIISLVYWTCITTALYLLGWSLPDRDTLILATCIYLPTVLIIIYLQSIYQVVKEINRKIK